MLGDLFKYFLIFKTYLFILEQVSGHGGEGQGQRERETQADCMLSL